MLFLVVTGSCWFARKLGAVWAKINSDLKASTFPFIEAEPLHKGEIIQKSEGGEAGAKTYEKMAGHTECQQNKPRCMPSLSYKYATRL